MFRQMYPWIFVKKYNFQKHFYSILKTASSKMVGADYKLHHKVFN